MPMPLFTTHTRNEPRSYSVYLFRAQNLKTNDFTKLLVTLTRPVIRRHLISQVMQTGSIKYSGVWRPTSVGSYSRTLPYPRLNLSMEKRALSLLCPLCSLLAGGEGGARRAGPRSLQCLGGEPRPRGSRLTPAGFRCKPRPCPGVLQPPFLASRWPISEDQKPHCPNSVGATALPPASGGTTSPGSPRARPAPSHLRPKRVPEPSARRQASK